MCKTTFRSIFRIKNSFPTLFSCSEVMVEHKYFVKQRFSSEKTHKYYYISNWILHKMNSLPNFTAQSPIWRRRVFGCSENPHKIIWRVSLFVPYWCRMEQTAKEIAWKKYLPESIQVWHQNLPVHDGFPIIFQYLAWMFRRGCTFKLFLNLCLPDFNIMVFIFLKQLLGMTSIFVFNSVLK